MIRTIALATLFALLAAPQAQAPQPRFTLVHTVRGVVTTWASSRDGKRIYFVRDSTQLVMFDRATGRETPLGEMRTRWGLDVSPSGDRLAFTRRSEDGRGENVWTIALNPATGHTSGPPARVSMKLVDAEPRFSPDGKSLTLSGQQSIAIVPANGGPERVLMRGSAVYWPVRWTPDGKSIYAGVSFNEEAAFNRNGIYRIPVDGGNPQLVARTAHWGAYPGLSPDGKHLVYWKAEWDSVIVQTVSGAHLAAFRTSDGQDAAGDWFDATRGYRMPQFQPRALSLRLTNPERTVALADTFLNPPVVVRWAPDGKRIAAYGRSPKLILMMNADGSVQRRLPVQHGTGPIIGMSWSPDGQRLMYMVVGAGIHVVDVATGVESDSIPGNRSVRPIWRSDSRAILYGTNDGGLDSDSMVRVTIRERILGGSERVVRTFRARCFPQNCNSVKLASDSVAVAWQGNEYRSIPLRNAGDARVVYSRPGGAGQPVPTFSENGQWMAVRVAVQGERLPRRIDVMRIDGSNLRTVQLNMTTLAGGENPLVSDDGRTLFVLGTVDGGFEYQRVDVATGRSTRIATFQTNDRTGLEPSGLSPDGRAVLYHTALPPYAQIQEVDMSSVLRAGRPAGRLR